MGRASFATHLVPSRRVSTGTRAARRTQNTFGGSGRMQRLILIQDRDRTPFRAVALRVPRQRAIPRLRAGGHAGVPCTHQPGGCRGMVHREARHTVVAAMRGEREPLVVGGPPMRSVRGEAGRREAGYSGLGTVREEDCWILHREWEMREWGRKWGNANRRVADSGGSVSSYAAHEGTSVIADAMVQQLSSWRMDVCDIASNGAGMRARPRVPYPTSD